MRKLIPILLGATLALSSCENTADDYQTIKDNEISFTSDILSRMTRVSGDSFESSDEISVFAIEGSSIYADNVKYSYDGSKFISTSPISYDSEDQALAFAGIYPYDAEYAGSTVQFAASTSQSDDAAYAKSDLLISHVSETTNPMPELVFDHKMSLIDVNITTDIDLSSIGSHIYAKTAVEYDVVNNSIEAVGNVEKIYPNSSWITDYEAIVAPQVIKAGEAFIVVEINDVEYEWVLSSDVKLESGYIYECNVNVSEPAPGEDLTVTFTSGDITEWNDGGDLGGSVVEEEGGGDVEVAGSIEIQVVNIEDGELVMYGEPSEEVVNYVYGAIETDYFNGELGGDVSAATDFITAKYVDYGRYGVDLAVADGDFVLSGDTIFYVSKLWEINAGSTYTIFVYGVNSEGVVTSEVATLERTVPGEPAGEDSFVADITVSNITSFSADLSIEVNDQSQDYLYGLFYTENVIFFPNDNDLCDNIILSFLMDGSIDDHIMNGNASGTLNLTAGTDISVIVFAIDTDGYTAISSVYREDFTTTPGGSEPSDWYGTWKLTSTTSEISGKPLSVDVVIQQGATASDINIYGWDLSPYRWSYSVPATVNEANIWSIIGTDHYLETTEEGDLYYNARGYVNPPYDEYSFFGADGIDAFTASLGADDIAKVTGYSAYVFDGTPFTLSTMVIAVQTEVKINMIATDPSLGFDANEALVGPFTLEKVSSDVTLPSSAPANVNVIKSAISNAVRYSIDKEKSYDSFSISKLASPESIAKAKEVYGR